MLRHVKKWAVHKAGTEQFGCLCSFREEAEQMLDDLHQSIYSMPESERRKYRVVEVDIAWEDTDALSG